MGRIRQIATLGSWANSLQTTGACYFFWKLAWSWSLTVFYGRATLLRALKFLSLRGFLQSAWVLSTLSRVKWSTEKRNLEGQSSANTESIWKTVFYLKTELAVFSLGMNSTSIFIFLLGKHRPYSPVLHHYVTLTILVIIIIGYHLPPSSFESLLMFKILSLHKY